jgi:hypothetical protein
MGAPEWEPEDWEWRHAALPAPPVAGAGTGCPAGAGLGKAGAGEGGNTAGGSAAAAGGGRPPGPDGWDGGGCGGCGGTEREVALRTALGAYLGLQVELDAPRQALRAHADLPRLRAYASAIGAAVRAAGPGECSPNIE